MDVFDAYIHMHVLMVLKIHKKFVTPTDTSQGHSSHFMWLCWCMCELMWN